uniref:Glycosaminoglycan xylosylkinase-like n=1 Tax=Phallusia mammillata TaxID=59560 RepID=A0A6F9DD68_9ASCI|nr:glycosaminoglycan xylosylkinase-like [Phallusia mammillata]
MKFKQRFVLCVISFIVLGSLYKIINRVEQDLPVQDTRNDDHILPVDGQHEVIVHNNNHKPFESHKKSDDLKDVQKTDEQKYVESELLRLKLDFKSASIDNSEKLFQVAASWVGERQIYPTYHKEMASILKLMSTSKIVQADALPRGTQIKLLLVLEGGQKVVFKQKRYERDHVIEGKPYDGYDRHNAEIAAFHLDRIFDFRRAPLVVGRVLNLKTEVMPVATERLLKTFRNKDNNICYFGICLYCKEEEMACANGEIMEGSVTLWLPDEWSKFTKQRHPYQRTYIDGRSAKWEVDETYCDSVVKHKPPYDSGPRLLDITDGAVFDYLIGNADRHHYEVFKDHGPDVMMLMLDNAKSFGNPNVHDPSILAPLRQCCLLRNTTLHTLHKLSGGVLTKLLKAIMDDDPIAPILHQSHLKAMEIRLPRILDTMETCIKDRGKSNVIVESWTGT